MKKLKKERKRFNREYLKPITGGFILFLLIVALLVIFNYNPSSNKKQETESKDKYSLDVNDKTITNSISCDSDYVKKIKDELNKINVELKTTEVKEEEHLLDIENSSEEEEVYSDSYALAYEVKFTNVTENFRILISNDSDNNTNTITKDIPSFVTTYTGNLVNYTAKVYSINESCKDALVREFGFTTPAYNQFSDLAVCKDSNESTCDMLIYNNVDLSKKSVDYEIKINSNTDEKKEESKSNIGLYIVIGIIAVVVIIVIIFFIYRSKRKRMVMYQ